MTLSSLHMPNWEAKSPAPALGSTSKYAFDSSYAHIPDCYATADNAFAQLNATLIAYSKHYYTAYVRAIDRVINASKCTNTMRIRLYPAPIPLTILSGLLERWLTVQNWSVKCAPNLSPSVGTHATTHPALTILFKLHQIS